MLSGRTFVSSRHVICAALATIVAAALKPSNAAACPTCFAASGEGALHGYYLSTALLSAMPFLLIGLIALIAYAAKRRSGVMRETGRVRRT